MKPQNLHDEQKIREKIQGLKTPVQEADWQQMLALLESDELKGGIPLPDLPPPAHAAAPTRAYRRWLPVLLGLLVAGAWWMVMRSDTTPKDSHSKSSNTGPEHKTAQPAVELPIIKADTTRLQGLPEVLTAQKIPGIEASSPAVTSFSPKSARADGPRSVKAKASAVRQARRAGTPGGAGQTASLVAGSSQSEYEQTSTATPVPPQPQSPAAVRNQVAAPGGARQQNNPGNGQAEAPAPAGDAAQVSATTARASVVEAPANPLALLPLLPMENLWLPSPQNSDSLVRPTPRLPRLPRRFQRGLILGLNANMVNYDALRLSIMPHLGYHISMPLTSGYRFQAECQLKYVSNYREHTAFMYVAPGSVLEITWDMNNLFFVELPLLLKKENPGIGRASWLLGLKPAWCTPVFPAGSYSVRTSGSLPSPQVDIELRDGVRQFDFGVVLGMEWRFSRQWALDLRYNQGIMDLTHDNFFKNTTTHLNTDVQVTLRHYVHPYKNNRHAKTTASARAARPDQQRRLQKRR